ncbi:MAG: M23 family metallopeptidase [Ruminococcus sp.]|jgi:murein DD-endopeptidase MepM/ murein hydrolase activator NlpD|nr:M23 family metallopeptidase [Ruminococcus sp.]
MEIKEPKKPIHSKKGLYTALSISGLMVLSAVVFALTQSNYEDKEIASPPAVTTSPSKDVGKSKDDVPKQTEATTERKISTYVPTVPATKIAETAPATAPVNAVPTPAAPINLIMPLAGDVVGEFSNGELVKSSTTGAWQTHNGVDISAQPGDPVKAISGGTVIEVTNDALWGVVVSIDHDGGIISRYCGLNKDLSVAVGEKVKQGAELGTVGTTADIEVNEPSHLHLEVKENGRFIDPVGFINKSE